MSTERFNMVIPDYERYVQLSAKRRAKYYYPGDTLSKKNQKLLDKGLYIWKDHKLSGGDIEQRLYEPIIGDFIIKNLRTAGTPNKMILNGQSIWNGNMAKFTRNKVRDFLHDYYIPFIKRQLPEKIFTTSGLFIQIEYIFYENLNKKLPDYFNHALIYMKTFEDTIVELGVIQDDDPSFLRGGYPRYVHIEDETERRLEIKFHFCKNNERIS